MYGVMPMADDQDRLALFFKIIDLKGQFFAIGEAVKAISEAILQDAHFAKFADVVNAVRALEKSHARQDAMVLLAELGKWSPNMNVGIPAGVRALLALMGDVESERYAAWLILYRWRHQPDISKVERSKLLVSALGWLMQSVGACQLTASRLGAEDTGDLVNLLGYALAAEIKALRLDASNVEALVDRKRNDVPVQPGAERYKPGGWVEMGSNELSDVHKLPENVVGIYGVNLYLQGSESPLLQIGTVAARIRARTGSKFETLCDHVINNPADFVTAWHLIDALRHQKNLDLGEEVEGLIAALAFAGDRSALLEASAYALRRGYHTADKRLISFALGAVAIASGAREVAPCEPNDNGVDTSIEFAGDYLISRLMEQAVPAIKARIAADLGSYMKAEGDIGAERRADEEAERQAASQSSAEGDDADDLIDDEVIDTPEPSTPSPSRPLSSLQRRVAQIRAQGPETLRVVHSIGNCDIAAPDTKSALRRLAELENPLKLATMPTDLSAWRQGLLAEFPHAENAINSLHGDLISRQMNGKKAMLFKPTLLVGSPGCGKSRLARRVAESCKIGYRVMPCGGVADSHFGGVSRGWHSSHPSSPLDLIRQAKVPNPVVVLDEIEKAATSKHNGNFIDTILAMLEPETSHAWNDPFIQGPINLSAVNWLATANSLAGIPAPLLDRLRIIHVDAPDISHLPLLSATILKEISSSQGHDAWHQPLDQIELNAIGKAWVRQPSLRYLRRLIEGALRAREQSAGRH
jgi:hypothetical protein